MGVATSLQEITPKMNGQKRRPYVNCSQPLYFLAVQQPDKNRGLQSNISYPYAPVLPPGAPSPPPCIKFNSTTPTSTCDKFKGRQIYLSQGVRNIKVFTHRRYWYHCSVQSRKDALCVCSARVSLANLSLYNLCHSYRICTLCLMCHESTAN